MALLFVFSLVQRLNLTLQTTSDLKGMEYKPVVFDTMDQTSKGFDSGRCDVLDFRPISTLRTTLELERSKLCDRFT